MNTSMVFVVNPNASPEGQKEWRESPETGCCSSIHPSNRDYWPNLRAMFHCDDAEELCGIVIKDDGTIQARIRRLPVIKRYADRSKKA